MRSREHWDRCIDSDEDNRRVVKAIQRDAMEAMRQRCADIVHRNPTASAVKEIEDISIDAMLKEAGDG